MSQSENNNKTFEDHGKFKDGVNKNARLMVRNISFKATEDALKEHFSKYGTVEEAKLLKKPDGRLVGCGFVHFTQVPMANNALAATNKKPFLDRPINVTWAIPKNKYAEQIQGNNVKKRTESASSEDKESTVKKETETKQEKKNRVNRNARLIIRNVSFKATEESLQEHFKPYGEVLEVKLLKKPDGKLVGCAFVHFKNVPMAKKALLNTNMKPFLGRPISVDWAVAKNKYMQHIVNQQLEMQDDVKKEESDSDDDSPLNTSNDPLKQEIKSESEDESENEDTGSESDDEKSENDDDSDEEADGDDNEEEGEESEESDDEDEDMEQESQADPQERKRIQLNDAEDGCTVFLTNIAFSVDNDQLREFAETTGPVKYALICVDRMTEHSKGSGFVKFENKEDADKFLALPAEQLKLDGQVMQAKPALKRENLQKDKKKEAKDNRNLYLVKEGVIVAGTKAAEGVSSSDMSKRLALERSKTQMLKNLNRFVSRYRLVVSNLPPSCEDGRLRGVCAAAGGRNAEITEARVMRDLRAPTGPNGKHPSKGYGFVTFTRHEDALACLRKLNNNPDIFDKNNRPVVSFSIEDRTALNARKKRLEKSIANNPLANTNNNKQDPEYNAENAGNVSYQNRKRKAQQQPEENYVKKGRFNKNVKNDNRFNNDASQNNDRFNKNNDRFNINNVRFNKNNNRFNKNNDGFNKNNDGFNKNNDRFNKNNDRFNKNNRFNKNKDRFNKNEPAEVGKFVKRQNDEEREYTGLTAKEGALHKMRNNHKLRAQAQIHKETVKRDKKNSKRALRLKRAAKERVKQPKQKVNKDKLVQSRRNKKKFNKLNA